MGSRPPTDRSVIGKGKGSVSQYIIPVILVRDSRPRWAHHQPRYQGRSGSGPSAAINLIAVLPPLVLPAPSKSDARCPFGGLKGLRFPASDLAGECHAIQVCAWEEMGPWEGGQVGGPTVPGGTWDLMLYLSHSRPCAFLSGRSILAQSSDLGVGPWAPGRELHREFSSTWPLLARNRPEPPQKISADSVFPKARRDYLYEGTE